MSPIPRNSSGVASLVPSYFAETGQTITTVQHNPPLEDIASMITDSLPRSGVAGMLANLPMGGFRITNLGAPASPSDAARLQDIQLIGIPVGGGCDWYSPTAPTNWVFPYGQALSRTTYATLFSLFGTRFGAGDGTNTFNMPDLRGRVTAGKDDMGGVPAGRLTTGGGVSGTTLGSFGGFQVHNLTEAENGPHNHGGVTTVAGSHTHPYSLPASTVMNAGGTPIRANNVLDGGFNTGAAGDHQHGIPVSGGGNGHNNVQPTFIVNKIIRVL